MATITVNVDLTTIHCGCCGGTYAINEGYRQKKYKNGGYWNCPYCKGSWGYGDTEAKRLSKQLAAERAKLDQERARVSDMRSQRDRMERRLKATRGVVTRTKNRIAKGVCPCCNRYFADLHKHMTTKHPDYSESQDGGE